MAELGQKIIFFIKINKLFKPLGFQVFFAETQLGEFGVRTYRHVRIRRLGWQILWTPDAVLEHWESVSRGRDEYDPRKRELFNRETLWMKQRWASQLIPPIEESPLHLHKSPALPRDSGHLNPVQHAAPDRNRFSNLVAK
jgi:hypothetical protein